MNRKVLIRVRPKNIHLFVDEGFVSMSGVSKQPRYFNKLRDIVGFLAAGTSLFVGLLYLAGRSYADGYFAAMNIPSYQVGFSLWEYSEVAWLPLLLYPISMIAFTGLTWGIVLTIRDWISPLFTKFRDWLRQQIKLKLPAIHLSPLSHETRRWYMLAGMGIFTLLGVLITILTLLWVRNWGVYNGRNNVLENSAQVELISAVPMLLEDNNLTATQASGKDYYIYTGFHLLTLNNGKYYLFKGIDPASCRPLKVFVIDASQNLQVDLLPAILLTSECHNLASQQLVTPTTTVTPTP